MNIVYITDAETGLRRDGVRAHIRHGHKNWTWNVTVPILRRDSSSCMCIDAGETTSQAKARAAVKAVLVVYDKHRARRRSLGDTARNATNELGTLKRRVDGSLSVPRLRRGKGTSHERRTGQRGTRKGNRS